MFKATAKVAFADIINTDCSEPMALELHSFLWFLEQCLHLAWAGATEPPIYAPFHLS